MTTYATGGKVWKFTEDTAPPSLKDKLGLLLPLCAPFYILSYMGLIIAIVISSLISAAFMHKTGANDYTKYLAENGGFIVDNSFPLWDFSPVAFATIILLPIILTTAVLYIQIKYFAGKPTSYRNAAITVGIMFAAYIGTAVFITADRSDIKEVVAPHELTAKMGVWMNDRYGFHNGYLPMPKDIQEGKTITLSAPTSGEHDVQLINKDGAYLLYDMNGTELPVKK